MIAFPKMTPQTGNDSIILNGHILVEAKQIYLDGLWDLYSYQKRLRFLCYQYIHVFATTDKDDRAYVPKQF